MILKQVIKYTNANAIEASWVMRTEQIVQIPDPEWVRPMVVDVAAVAPLVDDPGNEGVKIPDPDWTPPLIEDMSAEAPLIDDVQVTDSQTFCKSYADVQMRDFREDVALLGGDIAEYEAMIAEVEAGIQPIPEPSAKEVAAAVMAEAKRLRAEAVAALTVTTSAGNTYDSDKDSLIMMGSFLSGMSDTDIIPWVLADNSVIQINRAELLEALRLGGSALSVVWVSPYL